jgi:hypothetical protein
VEGPTEVTAVSQLLRKIGKDHEVVLLPLGGDSLINASSGRQLSEIKRLSSSIAALIDSERTAADTPLSETRQQFVRNCERLKIPCHVLELRAFENYLPNRAIKEVKGPNYSELAPFQLLREAEVGWSKEENWRICERMTFEEFQRTGDLFTFLSRFAGGMADNA